MLFKSWLTPSARPAKGRAAHFVPQIVPLEDRTVPATYFVDSAFTGLPNGSVATFNDGFPGSVPGIVVGTNGFADLADGIRATEAISGGTAGADTIRIARGIVTLSNPAVTGGASSSTVREQLDIIGSGIGATKVEATNDTTSNGVADEDIALIRILGGPANPFTASDFTLAAPELKAGAGFTTRLASTSTFTRVGVSSIIFNNGGVVADEGSDIVAIEGSTVNVIDSQISSYGRVGVLLFDSTGNISGTSISGDGTGVFVNNGVEANGSKVKITDSVITRNSGEFSDGEQSSAIVAIRSTLNPTVGSTVTVIGNQITGNAFALAAGDTPGDPSTIQASCNNIFSNEFGADGVNATSPIDARNNFWGDPTGPFNEPANLGGKGNPVFATIFQPFLTVATPIVPFSNAGDFATQKEAYRTAITTVATTVNPVGPASLNTPTSSVQFAVMFDTAVAGFDASDVVVTTTTGGTPTVDVSGGGANYTVTVSGLTGDGTVSLRVNERAASSTTDGSLTVASNTANITIQTQTQTPTPVTVTVNPANGPFFNTPQSSVAFTVTFAEAVAGFDASDVVVTSTTGGTPITNVTGGGASYTVTVTGIVGNGTVTLRVPANRANSVATNQPNTDSNTASVTIQTPTPVPPVPPGPPVPPSPPVPPVPPGPPVPPLPPVPPVPVPPAAVKLFAFGVEAGSTPEVEVFNADGQTRFRFMAFETTYSGGVHVSTGDVSGDGVDDVIVGAGIGGGPRVRIFDGVTGNQIADFFAYDSSVRTGVFVATGDLKGIGISDVITGPGVGGGPHVKVFTGRTGQEQYGFFAFESTFRGGVTVGAGDLDGDGRAEIVAGTGAGSSPRVSLFRAGGQQIGTFLAFDQAYMGGVFVAIVPSLNGQLGRVVVGPGSGQAPTVKIFSPGGQFLNSFNAYEPAVTSGVRVASGDTNGDGVPDIITAPGVGGGPRVRGFSLPDGTPVFDKFAFDGLRRNGFFVG